MVNKDIIVNYLRQNKSRLHDQYHIKKIGLFGSFARAENTLSSDIDIILEFENNTEDIYILKNRLRDELQSEFRLPVDLCREKYIKPIFLNQILSQTIYV